MPLSQSNIFWYRHGRPHIGANGVSWSLWKNGRKIKKREHAKRAVFLCLYYILRAIRAGRCRERRYADHIFIQIYFRMHHFVVKFSKFSSPQAAKGPPNPLTKILRMFLGTGQGAVMPCGREGNRRSGHASQTSVVYSPTGSRPKKGRWAPRPHSSWGYGTLCQPISINKRPTPYAQNVKCTKSKTQITACITANILNINVQC